MSERYNEGMSTSTTAAAIKFVTYRRVSTDEQGRSGLGLDAQTAAIAQYVEGRGGRIVRDIAEVASGADDNRAGLREAIALARRTGSVLVVARLDRMGRSVALIAGLIKAGLRFAVCDRPNASELELHLIAMLAQEERRLISERTRGALRALIARGVLLGSRRPGHWVGHEARREEGGAKGRATIAATRRASSLPTYVEVADIAAKMPEGSSLRTIAAAVEAAGIMSPTGATSWSPSMVKRALTATATIAR